MSSPGAIAEGERVRNLLSNVGCADADLLGERVRNPVSISNHMINSAYKTH
jgi:hypothetical protein